jgi:hypothetical protein
MLSKLNSLSPTPLEMAAKDVVYFDWRIHCLGRGKGDGAGVAIEE